MKIEITNSFIKEITKTLKKEIPYLNGYLEVYGISVDFLDKPFYTLDIHWGCEKVGLDEHPVHNSAKLSFYENASLDYIRGMFSRIVLERDEGVKLKYDN